MLPLQGRGGKVSEGPSQEEGKGGVTTASMGNPVMSHTAKQGAHRLMQHAVNIIHTHA